jgi:hypothetical protein
LSHPVVFPIPPKGHHRKLLDTLFPQLTARHPNKIHILRAKKEKTT